MNGILANRTLICCLTAWFSAQLAKYLIDGLRKRFPRSCSCTGTGFRYREDCCRFNACSPHI